MTAPDKTDRLITAALAATALLFLLLTGWLQWYWSSHSMDIDVYWEAGRRMLHGGADLYLDSEDPANNVGLFIYPPLFATLFAPLTVLPRWLGYALWGMLELALVALGLRSARQLVEVPGGRKAREFYLLMLVGLFGALWTNLQEGQVNMLVVCVLLAGMIQLERGRPLRGGLLIAVATHLKVIPIVLLPILLAQKRFKAAGAMLCGIALLWLAPLFYSIPNYGVGEALSANVQLSVDYRERIIAPRLDAKNATGLGGSRAPNNSLTAVMRRYFSEGQKLSQFRHEYSPLVARLPDAVVGYTGIVVAGLLGGLALLLAWRTRESRLGRTCVFGLALLSAALANLLFWPHHLCLLLLALAPLAASCMKAERPRLILFVVGTAMLLCYVPLLIWTDLFDSMAIYGTPTLGVLVIWGTAFIHFWRRSVAPDAEPPILRAHEETEPRNSAA
ncbi:MAG: DUF2029 domain-containing protein [Planctomycetes bacterium]|nr:DUF2029 domain-containing protein [Planctomycetota bacterium]